MSRSRATSWVIPLLLVAVALVTRVVLLDQPDRIIFDETYYVNDARDYLDQGVEDSFAVHPPVGKWLIAGGIAVFGDTPTGWRISGVLAGVGIVLLTYLAGLRLLRWRGSATLAGLLVLVDGLLFVQARISMLDIFLAFFTLLGAWLLLVDFDRSGLGEDPRELTPRRANAPPEGQLQFPVQAGGSVDAPPPDLETDDDDAVVADRRLEDIPVRAHPYRYLAGLAFGLAVATKWSGALGLLAAIAIVAGWELAWRRRLTGRATIRLGRLAGSVLLAFGLVPVVVYLLTYIPWFTHYAATTEGQDVCADADPCYVSFPGRVTGFARYQTKIVEFHLDLEATHPYRAPAYTWPVLGRPVVYYWENCDADRAAGVAETNSEGEVTEPEPCVVAQGNAGEILAVGNPALWWTALGALIPLAVGMWTRDRRAWFIAGFWGVQYVPWLAVQRPAFFFYMTPIVPFMALAVGYGTQWLDAVFERFAEKRGRSLRGTVLTPGAITGAVIALVAVGLFLYFYPVLTGIELDYDAVRQRWWFDSWI